MQSGSAPQVDDYFKDLNLPKVSDMEVQLKQLVEQGVISPEDAQAQLVQASAMNNISTDPKLKEAQLAALSGLQDISSSGGLTDADKANLNKIRTDENTAAKGKQDAIIQNASQRGLGGSGLDLMAQMQNAQDSATRTSQRDMDVAGQAQQRALDALIQGGQLGGQIQNQDFNQQAQVAGANDAISKFNAQNKQAVGLTNTAAHNTAQAANLAAKQGVANQNVGLQNQQQQYNKQLQQQNFDNEMKKRSGQAGIAQNNAQSAFNASQAQANANNQLIGAAIGAGSSIYGAKGKKDGGLVEGAPTDYDSVPQVLQPGEMVVRKDDVPDMLVKAHTDKHGKFDAAAFLDSITGHKYGYSKKGKA